MTTVCRKFYLKDWFATKHYPQWISLIQCDVKKKDHHVWWYFKHTITIIKHCDHNYEISLYIFNRFRLALIWPGNCFEEIYKWEIDVSNYLDISRIYLLLWDDFPTLLPSQTSLTVHSSFRVKRDSFQSLDSSIYMSIDVFC